MPQFRFGLTCFSYPQVLCDVKFWCNNTVYVVLLCFVNLLVYVFSFSFSPKGYVWFCYFSFSFLQMAYVNDEMAMRNALLRLYASSTWHDKPSAKVWRDAMPKFVVKPKQVNTKTTKVVYPTYVCTIHTGCSDAPHLVTADVHNGFHLKQVVFCASHPGAPMFVCGDEIADHKACHNHA